MMFSLIKASLVIMILLVFYKLFLEKESFFKANRVYLLACLAFACLLPFVSLPKFVQHQGYVNSVIEQQVTEAEKLVFVGVPEPEETLSGTENITSHIGANVDTRSKDTPTELSDNPIAPAAEPEKLRVDTQEFMEVSDSQKPKFWEDISWIDAIKLTYLLGVAILSFRLLNQVFQTLKRVYKNDDKIIDDGSVIVNVYGDISPCSFFKYIFINPEKYDYDTYEQILLHEKIHVEHHHSIDLVFAELAIVFMWFNPFVWMLRKEIEKNIEYQTDDILVNGSSEVRRNYQANLVKIASTDKAMAITTNYNKSLIKQRILKMNNEKSNNRSYWKYAFVAPLTLGLLVFLNKPNAGIAKSIDFLEGNIEAVTSAVPQQADEPEKDNYQPKKLATVGLFENSCHVLTQAVRDEDINDVEKLLKRVDADCVDPEPGYEEKVSKNGLYTMRRSNPRTPLATAAKLGNLAIGKLLVKSGASVDFDRGDHGSPVTEASSFGHLDFLKFLVSEGADLNHMTDGQGSSLHAAARKGHLETVKYLIEQDVPINRQNDGQGTPLNGAARNGYTETVAFLLEKGARINKQNDGQGSALNAAARNGHTETVKFLLDKGADMDLQNDGQGSALNAAARNGHTETITLLLDRGADMDRQNDGQGSALNAAARNGHTETITLLLDRGADIDRQNDGQGSALNAAARNGHTETITLLLDRGADIDRQNDGQGSALNAAARNGHIETIALLLERGADINRQNDGQGSPLNAAARNGHVKTVEFLLEKGASVNRQNDGQGSPLNAAARNGHLNVVKLLVENGARVNQRSDGQGTALDAAERNRHSRVVSYLRAQGGR